MTKNTDSRFECASRQLTTSLNMASLAPSDRIGRIVKQCLVANDCVGFKLAYIHQMFGNL